MEAEAVLNIGELREEHKTESERRAKYDEIERQRAMDVIEFLKQHRDQMFRESELVKRGFGMKAYSVDLVEVPGLRWKEAWSDPLGFRAPPPREKWEFTEEYEPHPRIRRLKLLRDGWHHYYIYRPTIFERIIGIR